MPEVGPTLFDAWIEAVHTPDDFWPNASPAGHFRFTSTLGPELRQALLVPGLRG